MQKAKQQSTSDVSDVKLKMIIIGQSGSGKSTLVRRQCFDHFLENKPSTLAIEYCYKIYEANGVRIQVDFWDSCGQERYESLTRNYLRNTNLSCLCFDMHDIKSFESLARWVQMLQRFNLLKNTYLVGCKSDLQSMISLDCIEQFAQSHKIAFMQTSAKSGEGVHEAFLRMAKEVGLEYENDKINSFDASKERKMLYKPVEKTFGQKHCCQ